MRTPLTILTTLFAISFFDGVFMWGLPDGLYVMLGFGMIICTGWMWVIESKN